MSEQYHPNTAGKWLCNGSFLKNRTKQRILRGSVENLTVPLPLDLPAQHCSDDFYAEHLADAMVVLCCDTLAGEVCCVALGFFVGDKLWANTLDPSLRFRGRRENFNTDGIVSDANHLLAPVHFVTSLLGGDHVVLAPQPLIAEPRLPGQLHLAVPDLQAALAAEPLPPGTAHRAQQELAHAVRGALCGVQNLRSDDVADSCRVGVVASVLAAMAGDADVADLPPTKRRNLAARSRAKATRQQTRCLLAQGAKNTRSSMALAYTDYDRHLPLLHSMCDQLLA